MPNTEREFTKRDWLAMEFAWHLFSEVATRGAPALDRFLAALPLPSKGEATCDE